MMAACFLIIAAIPGMTTMVVPFLLVYGVSYLFAGFGPNMTTFVMPSELYPVTGRATGTGSRQALASWAPSPASSCSPAQGLPGPGRNAAAHRRVSVLGFALILVLPEPAGRSLEDTPVSLRETATMRLQVAGEPSPPCNPHLRAAGQARSVAVFIYMSDSVHLVFIWAALAR
jgi:PHS family inorganic phosphate transporter-like MFS transporter